MKTETALKCWIDDFLPSGFEKKAPLDLSPVTGDAGFRQYFRCNTEPPLIAVHAPPEHEDVPAFVSKDLALASAGVGVPRVYGVEYHSGYMLQEDLGAGLLLPLLNENSVDLLYDACEGQLRRIQSAPPDAEIFPHYSQALLRREMMLFPEWFLEQLLEFTLTDTDKSILDSTFTLLECSALEQPQVVVHRDFHSRNLLRKASGDIGVIDFQDAVVGPFSYDLVSLLKDCYIRWPQSLVRERALRFLQGQVASLSVTESNEETLVRWFDLMGLQRHLKVLGIFARLWLRDGKSAYLGDLPLVLDYTLETIAAYPELREFNAWFIDRVVPLLSRQQWYTPLPQ